MGFPLVFFFFLENKFLFFIHTILPFLVGSESIENIIKKRKESAQKDEAFKRLKEDIDTTDDDHLDINLVQEEIFLKQYLSLLEK